MASLAAPAPEVAPKGGQAGVPILLYHRFGPTVADSMTVTTAVFESHLRYLKENGYTVIPLRQLVDSHLGLAPLPPPRSVVIAADDAHGSVYTDMLPLVKKYRVPVTLFVYPSAVSNASYAMTWDQLRELRGTGLFDFQSHTFWHPNFKVEKRRLKPGDYEKFVDTQLRKARERLAKELGGPFDMLAWPFGICDDQLLERAAAAGYRATFTIVARAALPTDPVMKLPRFLMSNANQGKAFSSLLGEGPEAGGVAKKAPSKTGRRARGG
jgi:peptidoglycan/xylan/chitin deacetylase (PgdA/CDA1 family)